MSMAPGHPLRQLCYRVKLCCDKKKKIKQTQTKRFKDKKDKLFHKKKGRVRSSTTGDYLGSRHCCILPPQTSQSGLSKNPALADACRSRVLKAATSVLFLSLPYKTSAAVIADTTGTVRGRGSCRLPCFITPFTASCFQQGPGQMLPRPPGRRARGHPPKSWRQR